MADIPVLSDAAIDRLGALIVHADQLVDEIYFSSSAPAHPDLLNRAIRRVRDDLSNNEVMAFKMALDRAGRLPR
jgi:hypothetical protein